MRLVLLVLLAAGLAAAPAFALEVKNKQADRQKLPVDITSERLEAEDGSRRVRFRGQVVAKQGDVTLYAQQMDVFLQSEGEEIDRIEAQGSVRIVQGERIATAQKAVYFNADGRIVLTGSPRVHQGADRIEGEEIVVYLNEERSEVKGKVKATFRPKGDQQ